LEEGYKTNLLKRIITSIVIIIPIGVILFFDNALGFYLTIFIVSFFAIFEWNKANLDRPYIGFILIANFAYWSTYLFSNGFYPIQTNFLYGIIILNTALFDTFAYLVGSNIGKTYIVKKISPNKTLEGLVGGIFASGSFGAVLVVLPIGFFEPIHILYFIIGGISAFFGDLLMSSIKRQSGSKDTGSILPGHGGILDRLDSHLIATPVMVLLFLL
tara:strand:- start:95 stop:739 length:645 start_codon:yes stop_codon:yes gene_type:complete